MTPGYDVAVIGAGIVGLAHAWAAARRGLKVVVIDRDARANGASVRNFGFVTVTGQAAGDCWALARRSRAIWAEVAEAAGIEVLQRGLLMAVRRPESEAVVDAFLAGPMGQGCERLTPSAAAERIPALKADTIRAALYSPHELRVESRTALPRLAAWLADVHGVTFLWSNAVLDVDPPNIETSRGPIRAALAICCPGDDSNALFADRLAPYGLSRTKLQMMRLAPEAPRRMDCALMSDLGLVRYRGYTGLPGATALAARLGAEQPAHIANGVHLIVVRSADGTLVVGDSHHDHATPDPFLSDAVNALILEELESVLDIGRYRVTETWGGTYSKAAGRWRLTDRPSPHVRIVVVTSGCGASTAFGIGEETLSEMMGEEAAA